MKILDQSGLVVGIPWPPFDCLSPSVKKFPEDRSAKFSGSFVNSRKLWKIYTGPPDSLIL